MKIHSQEMSPEFGTLDFFTAKGQVKLICLFVRSFVCLFVRSFVRLFVCLFLSPFF